MGTLKNSSPLESVIYVWKNIFQDTEKHRRMHHSCPKGRASLVHFFCENTLCNVITIIQRLVQEPFQKRELQLGCFLLKSIQEITSLDQSRLVLGSETDASTVRVVKCEDASERWLVRWLRWEADTCRRPSLTMNAVTEGIETQNSAFEEILNEYAHLLMSSTAKSLLFALH